MRSSTDRTRQLGETPEQVFPRLAQMAAAALVVVLPLVVTPWGQDGYNQVKALTVYGLAGAAIVAWIATRLTTGRPTWSVTLPEVPIWAFLLAVLLSSATSVNARLSFFGAPGRYEGLVAFCAYVSFFFVGVHFFGSLHGMRSLAASAGVTATVASGYGLLQMLIPPLFPGEAFIKGWYSGLGMPRVPSTLGSPVVFGGYLSLMLPLLLALALSRSGWRRVAWLAAAGLGYAGAVLTLTRAAWLGIAAGTVVLVVGREGRQFRRVTGTAVVGAALIAGIILLTAVGSSAPVGSRVTSSVDPSTGSLVQRLYIWQHTLVLIRARPWLGWGLDTLGEVFPYDRPSLVKLFGVRPVIVDKAHNDVLQMAVSVGTPGALAYGAVWAAVVIAAARLLRRESGPARILAAGWLAAIVAYLVQVQFSFSAVALAPIVWLLAGSAAGWEAKVTGKA